jgi:hypothetical protein
MTCAPERDDLRQHRVLGVDLNAGHPAVCVLDDAGNPVGEPVSIDVATAGLRASRRDGRVRAAITALLDHAQSSGCAAVVVVENLNFAERGPPGATLLAAGNVENGCAAPWPVSPPAGSGTDSAPWPPDAAWQ